MSKTPSTQTNGFPRWLASSGISSILSSGEWITLVGLVWTESRMIAMDTKWKADGLGGWFKVRVTEELILYTGLSRRRQSEHLSSLQHKWHLIETRRCANRSGTEVRFNKLTIERLAVHCIVRLKGYEGGISNAPFTPDETYIWLRPDINGYGWHYTAEQMDGFKKGLDEDDRPNMDTMKRIMVGG
jgi:hypothetical protein